MLYFFIREAKGVIVYSFLPKSEEVYKYRLEHLKDVVESKKAFLAQSESFPIFERQREVILNAVTLNSVDHIFKEYDQTEEERKISSEKLLKSIVPGRIIKQFNSDVERYYLFTNGDKYDKYKIKGIKNVPKNVYILNKLLSANDLKEILSLDAPIELFNLFEIFPHKEYTFEEISEFADYFSADYSLYDKEVLKSLGMI